MHPGFPLRPQAICTDLERLRHQIYRSRLNSRAILDHSVVMQVRRGDFRSLSTQCRRSALYWLPSPS